MQLHRSRWRRRGAVAALFAFLPFPALAAERALGAWGPYLFLAIAVTLVVVLLLHEVLDDDASSERKGDPRYGNAQGKRN
jgi:heme exporter protein D